MSAGELQRREPGASFSVASAPYLDKYKLLADLGKKMRRGEIERVGPLRMVSDESGQPIWEARYIRLREPRPKIPRYAAMMAAGVGGMLTVGMMVWHARHVILVGLAILAGTAAAIVLLMYLLTHQPGCPGLHCSGCKG